MYVNSWGVQINDTRNLILLADAFCLFLRSFPNLFQRYQKQEKYWGLSPPRYPRWKSWMFRGRLKCLLGRIQNRNGIVTESWWDCDRIYRFTTESMDSWRNQVLRSAVGKTHDLRSDLWWTIPLHIFLDYTQKSTKSTLAVKLSVSAIIYPRWTATSGINGLALVYHWFYLGLSTPGDSLGSLRVFIINYLTLITDPKNNHV